MKCNGQGYEFLKGSFPKIFCLTLTGGRRNFVHYIRMIYSGCVFFYGIVDRPRVHDGGQCSTDHFHIPLHNSVKTISNEECTAWMNHNMSKSGFNQQAIQRVLPDGVNENILCTIGIYNEERGVFSVSSSIDHIFENLNVFLDVFPSSKLVESESCLYVSSIPEL